MGLHKGKYVSARKATKVWNKSLQRNKAVLLNTSTAQQVCSTTKACSSTQAQHNKRAVQQEHSAGCPFTQKCSYWFAFYLRKVSSMFSISSRNVASVANWRSNFLHLWRMVEWSRPPSSRPICDKDTSVNF